ncbi:MAG: glutamate synthase large subunit [Candidatus Obscuribacterales bacterium]|nr:glutamate synthase large subunit [Candidatus Obscuribacterales bacterium]
MNRNTELCEKDACGVGFIYRPQSDSRVLQLALEALANLEHRGACAADSKSTDGTGLMTAIPWRLFELEGFQFKDKNRTALVNCFLPHDKYDHCLKRTEEFFSNAGFTLLGWRKTPVNGDALGELAERTCPDMAQLFVLGQNNWSEEELNQKLMHARKSVINHLKNELGSYEYYIPSSSTRTVVYKAMVKGGDLGIFYPDLLSPHFESQWAVFHQRFSTNTSPKWRLAQPFRFLAHNGEINTLEANRHWLQIRQNARLLRGENMLDQPLVCTDSSDSANLDNMIEFYLTYGDESDEALMKLVPESLEPKREDPLQKDLADFYEYHAARQEAWDGPALLIVCDGISIRATLDRNGLRPARFTRLKDGTFVLASETGVCEFDPAEIIELGRLGPAEMISIDLESGKLKRNNEIKRAVLDRRPYGELLKETRIDWQNSPFLQSEQFDSTALTSMEIASGFNKEDLEQILRPMAGTAKEGVFSMGDDSRLACLSDKPRILYDYFKQRFAQVTNPPIDHIRERLVMSLNVYLSSNTRTIKLPSPILNEESLNNLISGSNEFKSCKISLLIPAKEGALAPGLETLKAEVLKSLESENNLIVLSDRGMDAESTAIPALLAVALAVNELSASGKMDRTSLLIETSQCWTVHHLACLLSMGVQAVCPYMALETIRHMAPGLKSQENYFEALEEGLLKILAKLGISTISSYIGGQIIECIGLDESLSKKYFPRVATHLGGSKIERVEQAVLDFHRLAFNPSPELFDYGLLRYRQGGEEHANNPPLLKEIHSALGLKADEKSKQKQRFETFAEMVNKRPALTVRDLLDFKSDKESIEIEHVESESAIISKFFSGGMSLGALSKEAHETLAIAMNRLGARSNSGEGGEDPLRYRPITKIEADGTSSNFPGLQGLKAGDHAGSRIRQLASGRFGVSTEYLATAEQLEIKIAQGAKPGEGGQLPGTKVSEYIAGLRRANPGTTLISPPPHHDIYSIEDLAQLIYDLKQVNPGAKIAVKLVAQAGIGTIASGVAKAGADIIQISGHDGGTGAAAISSIKHTGIPWELGLADAQNSLIANGLRDRVILRADGGMRIGRDVLVAALLGADEFGFGTLALIAQGCIMARVCHTNKCPVGIASQDEKLRRKFNAKPEQIEAFFHWLAEEIRHELAALGYTSLAELRGRTELLLCRESKIAHTEFDFNFLKRPEDLKLEKRIEKNQEYSSFLEDKDLLNAVEMHGNWQKEIKISNRDRSFGARLSGKIAKLHGENGFKGRIKFKIKGSAGQSFGAFLVDGLELELLGDSNDFVGKGMSGGLIALRPQSNFSKPWEQVIAGNTCLYGATAGTLFAAGKVGERFAVRNSGATAVVEGAGAHCLEYMTGGVVVVLGSVGRNCAAGMTGGLAFVFDEDRSLATKMNTNNDLKLETLSPEYETLLRSLIAAHRQLTGSIRAKHILDSWQESRGRFKQISPKSTQLQPALINRMIEAAYRYAG